MGRCGKPADSSTVFCGHVHGYAVELHNFNMKNVCQLLGRSFAAQERLNHYGSGQPSGKAKSGWNVYVSEQQKLLANPKKAPGKLLKTIGESWKGLPDEDKAAYTQPKKQVHPFSPLNVVDAVREAARKESRFGIGDVEGPLRPEIMAPLMSKVAALDKEFIDSCGGVVQPSGIKDCNVWQCCDEYGSPDVCSKDVSDDQQRVFEHYKKTLKAVAKLCQEKVDGLSICPLLYLQPGILDDIPSWSDDPMPDGWLVLLLCSMLTPARQIYLKVKRSGDLPTDMCPAVGDSVNLVCDISALTNERTFAYEMMRKTKSVRISCLTYHNISMRELCIDAITDVSNAAATLLRGTLLSDEEQEMKLIMQMMQKKHAKAKKAQLQTKQGIKRKSKTRVAKSKVRPTETQQGLDEEEEDEEDQADPEDDVADGDLAPEEVFTGVEDVLNYWEVRAAIQRHEADDAVDGDMPIMVDVAAQLSKTGADPAPVFEVRDPKTSKRLARLSVIRYGKPSESWSMYCYMHGCSLCFKATSMPSNEKILSGSKLVKGTAHAMLRTSKDIRGHGIKSHAKDCFDNR